jgi:cell division protein FtsI (penicillin-binding protein 3)
MIGQWCWAGGLVAAPVIWRNMRLRQLARACRLAVICFFIVFSVLGGRLVQLTVLDAAPTQRANAAHKQNTARPIITDRNNVVLATQITTVTLGADAAEIDDGGAMAAHLKTVLPRLNEARAKRLLSGKARYVTLMSGLTPAQKQDVLAFGDPALKLRRGHQSGVSGG